MTTTTAGESLSLRVAQRLVEQLGEHRYRMWFDRSARLEVLAEAGEVQVTVPNRFVADWIGRHYQDSLRQAAERELGRAVQVRVRVDPQGFPLTATGAEGGKEEATEELVRSTGRRELEKAAAAFPEALPRGEVFRYRFEDFVVGPSNELAYAAARRLAEEPEDVRLGPLFIHGGVGLGKTHLLQAICRRMLELRPEAQLRYLTGEQFTNEFIAAVRSGRIEGFRRRIRQLDLLAIDDLHFIANKSATQQEFLHCFDTMELSGARIVMASDAHPRLIRQFSQALVSRCLGGLVVEIKPPDTALRMRIVQVLAQRRGLSVMESVAAVLAREFAGSVRELEGALTKLAALAELSGTEGWQKGAAGENRAGGGTIGHALVNRLLACEGGREQRGVVTPERIVQVVCQRLGVRAEELGRPGRRKRVVLARSLVVHLARRLTTASYPEIAGKLGLASHSAAIAAEQRICRQIAQGESVVVHNEICGVIEQVPVGELAAQLEELVRRGG